MQKNHMGKEYARELEEEVAATQKCLSRMRSDLYDWKPHERSMTMGQLAVLVADMVRWIALAIRDGMVDFQTYDRFDTKDTEELLRHFDKNKDAALTALLSVSDEALEGKFKLKNGDMILMDTSLKFIIRSTINHLVHHRGQLTVYMRLQNIPVPSIYGPSADDKNF